MSENTNSDKQVYGAGISGQTNQGRTIIVGQGNYNERIEGNYIQGNYYAAREKQNLADAAAEIQELLKQLEKTNPTSTNKEKMVVVGEAVDRIENNPALKTKVINALKAGGTEAFKEAVDHPLVNILVATIEGWKEA